MLTHTLSLPCSVFRSAPAKLHMLLFILAIATTGLATTAAYADELRLEVIDDYADLHTGPGIGYPKFYVIEQGETISVLAKRPGWYEVELEDGKRGWATAQQISRTLQSTGEPADLPEVSFGDYLKNSWTFGFGAGKFSGGELSSADFFTINAGYRVLSWMSANAEFGRFYRSDTKGELYGLSLLAEPFSQNKVSPYLILGAGQLKVDAQSAELPQFDGGSAETYYSYGLGANYYIGRNFLVKAEYRGYSVSTDDDSETFDAIKIGFSAFF